MIFLQKHELILQSAVYQLDLGLFRLPERMTK